MCDLLTDASVNAETGSWVCRVFCMEHFTIYSDESPQPHWISPSWYSGDSALFTWAVSLSFVALLYPLSLNWINLKPILATLLWVPPSHWHFSRTRKNHPTIYMKPWKTANRQNNPEKEKPAKGNTVPDLKQSYKSIFIKTAWYLHQNRQKDQWNKTEGPEVTPTYTVN